MPGIPGWQPTWDVKVLGSLVRGRSGGSGPHPAGLVEKGFPGRMAGIGFVLFLMLHQ